MTTPMTWWLVIAGQAICILTAMALLVNGLRRLLSDRMTVAVIIASYVIYFIVAYVAIISVVPWRTVAHW